jgi:HK97 family phage major capsid protein
MPRRSAALPARIRYATVMVDGHPHFVLPPRSPAEQPLLVPMMGGGQVYNSLITRADAAALIPEDVADTIIASLPEQSAALQMFRRRTMSSGQTRLPVMASLPTAYFVNGDTGLKETSEADWDNVYLNAEEIAVIVPVPDAVLADTAFDVWAELEPWLREAIGRTLDGAIFFGVDKPVSWPDDLLTGATAAGNVVERGTHAANEGGLSEDFNDLMGEVEEDGYDVTGFVTSRRFRRFLRGARNADGDRLADLSVNEIDGLPVAYAMSGLFPTTGVADAEVFAGDWSQGIIGIRQDITIDRSNQGVIQDGAGNIVHNLWQQDLTAIRVVFRAAFAVPNPINRTQPDAGDRYPFAVLTSPGT